MRKTGRNLMNKGEVYTERTANLDGERTLMRGKPRRRRFTVPERKNPGTEPARNRKFFAYERLEPYEGKLSRTVLRREGAEQSAPTQPTAENEARGT
jgi:hypothetical protein